MELYSRFDRSDRPAYERAMTGMGANANEAREVLHIAIRRRMAADRRFGRTDEGIRHSSRRILQGKLCQPTRSGGLPTSQPMAMAGKSTPKRRQRRSWWDVVGSHVVETQRASQFGTAKALFNALWAQAETSGSPFERGRGNSRGSLVMRETNKTVALKTIQTSWGKIQDTSKKT